MNQFLVMTWAMILGLGCCLPSLSADGPKLSDEQLAAKAERLQKLLEEKIVQHHGMVPMLVRANDYQFPTAEDYAGAYQHRHMRGKTEEEVGIAPMHVWRAWENTTSNTAYYLRAATFQYRVTGDPQALEICRRTLGGIRYIYELPIEHGEKGFLCKPYGGVYSNQTSHDQSQCVTWGLAAYRNIASAEELVEIDAMTRELALHHMETAYIPLHGYFGRTNEEMKEAYPEMKWYRGMIFLPGLYLAWYGSGDPVFTKEIDRWNTACGKVTSLAGRLDRFKEGGYGSRRDLYLPAMLMEMDPSRERLWREAMVTEHRQAMTGLLPDGTWPTNWTYDRQEGVQLVESEGRIGRTGRSALYAMGCVSAQPWCPDEKMKEAARTILENLDEETFRFIMPLDADHPLPKEWVVESQMLDCDCLTAWLCAYWEGRFHGYW